MVLVVASERISPRKILGESECAECANNLSGEITIPSIAPLLLGFALRVSGPVCLCLTPRPVERPRPMRCPTTSSFKPSLSHLVTEEFVSPSTFLRVTRARVRGVLVARRGPPGWNGGACDNNKNCV
eukprot:279564-Prorocentrum_minimum.AAC.1